MPLGAVLGYNRAMDCSEIDDLTAPFLASDLALEVRGVYFDHTTVGSGPGPATAAVFEAFRALLTDADEGPVVLLALAALQLRQGVVLEPIRHAALDLIESGDAARAWRRPDANLNLQRRTALSHFAELLKGQRESETIQPRSEQ